MYINPGIMIAIIVPQNPPRKENTNLMLGKKIAITIVTATQLRVIITCLYRYYSQRGDSSIWLKQSFSIDVLHGFKLIGTPIVRVSEIKHLQNTIAQSLAMESGPSLIMTISGVSLKSDI